MNEKTKRHIASWVLLAVFVPMLILSSLHVHGDLSHQEDTCSECVQHHCHGHLGQLTTTIHACVLCQFLTLPFVAAVLAVLVLFHRINRFPVALRQHFVLLGVCGIPSLRAPPAV